MEGKGISVCYKHCAVDITNDPDKLKELVKEIILVIKMRPLGEPKVEKGADHLPGHSIIQMIETSHIAIHGFTKSVTYLFNLESCKDFDENKLMDYLKSYLKPNKVDINALYSVRI